MPFFVKNKTYFPESVKTLVFQGLSGFVFKKKRLDNASKGRSGLFFSSTFLVYLNYTTPIKVLKIAALKEVEEMKKHPEKYKWYTYVDELIKDSLKE